MQSRREFLAVGGKILGGLLVSDLLQPVWSFSRDADKPRIAGSAGIVKIFMRSDETGADVWFDPVGVYIQPGQTVRWILEENVHTTTAYHPANGNHSLRIPEAAIPWDSGYMVKPGAYFDVSFKIEGVYDYYCIPHEMSGMVGRIIVGKPAGPGTLSFDYFKGRADAVGWLSVPETARKAFPDIEQIMREKVVRRELLRR